MTSPRPFRILGVQQIALGSTDRAALETLWVELLGFEVVGSYRSEAENVDERILALPGGADGPGVEVDLMQPIDVARKPTIHEPALHHVGFWVSDLGAAVDWLSERGVRFTPGGIRKGAAGHDVCFIHPKADGAHPLSGSGVLIELVQAPPELLERHGLGSQRSSSCQARSMASETDNSPASRPSRSAAKRS